jgi:hypothetical protein
MRRYVKRTVSPLGFRIGAAGYARHMDRQQLSDALGRGSNRPPARVFNKGERVSKIETYRHINTKTTSRKHTKQGTGRAPFRADAAACAFTHAIRPQAGVDQHYLSRAPHGAIPSCSWDFNPGVLLWPSACLHERPTTTPGDPAPRHRFLPVNQKPSQMGGGRSVSAGDERVAGGLVVDGRRNCVSLAACEVDEPVTPSAVAFGQRGAGVEVGAAGYTCVGVADGGGFATIGRGTCRRGDNVLCFQHTGSVLVGALAAAVPPPPASTPSATRGFKLLNLHDGALFMDGRARGLCKGWLRPDAGDMITLSLNGGGMLRGEPVPGTLAVRMGRRTYTIAEDVAPGQHFLVVAPRAGGTVSLVSYSHNGGTLLLLLGHGWHRTRHTEHVVVLDTGSPRAPPAVHGSCAL